RVIDVKISVPAFGGDEPAPWAGLSGETGCRPPRAWWPHAWRGPIQSAVAAPGRCSRPNGLWNQFHGRDLGTRAGGWDFHPGRRPRAGRPRLGPALLAGPFFRP